MRSIFRILFVAIIAVAVFSSSCHKYEEGPKFSLASKKGRLAGTWKFDVYLQDGADKTSDYKTIVASESYVIEKDGKYTSSQTNTALFGGQTFSDAGTWTLIDSKESLRMISNNVGAKADTLKIIRLKSKELWLRSVSGKPVIEEHFVQ